MTAFTAPRSVRIAELEAERADRCEAVAQHHARIAAIDTELTELRGGIVSTSAFATMSRTDAIVAVLKRHGGALGPKDIQSKLVDAGRTDELNAVTATLTYLLTDGKVARPSKGLYRSN